MHGRSRCAAVSPAVVGYLSALELDGTTAAVVAVIAVALNAVRKWLTNTKSTIVVKAFAFAAFLVFATTATADNQASTFVRIKATADSDQNATPQKTTKKVVVLLGRAVVRRETCAAGDCNVDRRPLAQTLRAGVRVRVGLSPGRLLPRRGCK